MPAKYPPRVKIVEVGPRDGLQNELRVVSVETKVAFIESLVSSGITSVECGSFVSPKWVPQMADTPEVFHQLRRVHGVSYSALVPNVKGLEAALACDVQEVAIFASASESFSQHNINCSIAESLDRLSAVANLALRNNVRVRGYVSCVLGCPYEGEVSLKAVAEVSDRLSKIGCYEISLGDTIGRGTPLKAQAMIEAVAGKLPMNQLAVHFHDTWGQALANILAALQFGIAVIDSSVAGLGGCPYAPGASGNVATEDVIYMLQGMNIETGVDINKLGAAGRMISGALGRPTASRAGAALAVNQES